MSRFKLTPCSAASATSSRRSSGGARAACRGWAGRESPAVDERAPSTRGASGRNCRDPPGTADAVRSRPATMGRFPPRRPLLLALSFGLAAAPGLGCGDLDLPAGAIACGADQSCPRGLECIEGICGGPASGGGGDPDAGAADAALPTNIVFVTSTQHVAQDLGGLEGADRICADRAAAAGLPGTYVAWLSTRTVDARDRLAGARGWVR